MANRANAGINPKDEARVPGPVLRVCLNLSRYRDLDQDFFWCVDEEFQAALHEGDWSWREIMPDQAGMGSVKLRLGDVEADVEIWRIDRGLRSGCKGKDEAVLILEHGDAIVADGWFQPEVGGEKVGKGVRIVDIDTEMLKSHGNGCSCMNGRRTCLFTQEVPG